MTATEDAEIVIVLQPGARIMPWQRIAEIPPPGSRPVLVRTVEAADPVIAFLGPDGIWYAGGALVQGSTTVLGATPTEWCEPDGEDSL